MPDALVPGPGSAEDQAPLPLLAAPAEPVPAVAATGADIDAAIAALAAGTGPLAVDTERAHGFRYSARAYLIQLRRTGAGTHLVDPIGLWHGDEPADLSALAEAVGDAPWIIHAATQDLPCLAEVRLVPTRLFDTELAGRLLGWPRVGLGPMVERVFGRRLAKEHSAADWSTRPLPQDWLTYAALDVELLIELRAHMLAELTARGRAEWAEQEFAHLVAHAADAPPERPDPWRRTSGIQKVRTPLGMAVVRALWEARDTLARDLDRAPGRILKDTAIADLGALVGERRRVTRAMLRDTAGFERRAARRYESRWLTAAEQALELPKSQRPPMRRAPSEMPNPKSWSRRAPEADERRKRMRVAMDGLAAEHGVAADIILSPAIWRRLAWEPSAATPAAVDAWLAEQDARPWQRELTAAPLADAIAG